MKRSTLNFTLLFFGICVMFAGVALWLATVDYDHHYSLESVHDTYPDTDLPLSHYEDLPAAEQKIVRGAIAGKRYTFQTPDPVPPPFIEYEDRYYLFTYLRSFDWTDLWVFGSTFVTFTGAALMGEAVRREQFPHSSWRAIVSR